MVETERAGHARELVEGLALAELDSYDGIVAVSGPTQRLLCMGQRIWHGT